jgi:hypothetical protein
MSRRQCTFTDATAGTRCSRCDYKLPRDYPNGLLRNCSGPPGWGDRLADFIERRIITKAGWIRLKVRCGFADSCGCGERQEQLNLFGRYVGQRLRATWRRILATIR